MDWQRRTAPPSETEKLHCEPKRADQLQDLIVLYLLIPRDAIADNMTFKGTVKSYEHRSEDA